MKNLEGEVSNIQQSANKISLSVTGGLGSTASIILDVNGNKQTEDLDLGNVRQSFANDNSAVTISGGKVTFNSGTFVVNSSNLKVTENGTITATNGNFSGTITGSTIRGSTLYSETTGQNGTSVSIQGRRMNLHYGSTDVGYIGTNRWILDPSKRGIVFDLNLDGSFMAWGAQKFTSSDFYIKLFYAADDLYLNSVSLVDKFVPDRLYFECDGQFRKKAYVGKVPNVPDGYLMGEGHGVYLTAAYGKFVSLSVGESEFLRIDENLINIYEETVVGTWIDGKPLYRKVFTGLILRYSDSFGSGNMTNPDGTKVSLSGDVDVSSVIFLDCYYVDSNGQVKNGAYHPNDTCLIPKVIGFDIWADYRTLSGDISNITVVVEYTKTTD